MQAFLHEVDPSVLALASLGVGLTIGLVLMISGMIRITRRVKRRSDEQVERVFDLTQAANAIATNKDFSIRAVKRSEDEFGLLVDTFNRMLDQLELYEQRRAREVERAEETTVAKARFLATMSHEIRTPINGIMGMSQLLADTELNTEQSEYAHTILASADGLLAIVNDILDFSKGEAGAFEFESITFSPRQVVQHSVDTVRTTGDAKGLRLSASVEKTVPRSLKGDPTRIRQVLLNFLSNAVKFTEEGEVSLNVRVVTEHENSLELRFEVVDTGIGIPADRAKKLFRDFSQVDASNSRKYGGTGLGLAISKQIVEAMGGSIFVHSAEGRGSTFGFHLELERNELAEDEPVSGTAGIRILVVEENESIRESLGKMLVGNELQITGSGLAGRRMLLEPESAGSFDLVIASLGSLHELGISAEAVFPFPTIPLLLLTPLDQFGTHVQLEWPGTSASLARPIKERELHWAIGNLLGEPDQGASFWPAAALPHEPSESVQAAGLGNLRILVVEDHPVNQRITTRFLENLGVRWELAQNGAEAIESFLTRGYSMILMDLQMPVMDGLEAARTIREHEREKGGRIPIIAMTASVLEEDQEACEEAGFDDYVSKPVKMKVLEERLRAWSLRARSF